MSVWLQQYCKILEKSQKFAVYLLLILYSHNMNIIIILYWEIIYLYVYSTVM